MAGMTGTPSRRAMLGVLAAAPLAAAPVALAAPLGRREQLHAQWLDARRAREAAWATFMNTEDRTPAAHRAGAVADRAMQRLDAIEGELLRLPAPHTAALLWKIEYALQDDGDGGTFDWTMVHISPVVADARRLLGQGAAS